MKLALDSNVLSFYLARSAEPDCQAWWSDVQDMFKLSAMDLTFYVPSLVLSEVACGLPLDVRDKLLPILLSSNRFKSLIFDDFCAIEASKLFGESVLNFRKHLLKVGDEAPGRQCVQIDMMILATAVANKLDAICTYDKFYAKAVAKFGLDIDVLQPADVVLIHTPVGANNGAAKPQPQAQQELGLQSPKNGPNAPGTGSNK